MAVLPHERVRSRWAGCRTYDGLPNPLNIFQVECAGYFRAGYETQLRMLVVVRSKPVNIQLTQASDEIADCAFGDNTPSWVLSILQIGTCSFSSFFYTHGALQARERVSGTPILPHERA